MLYARAMFCELGHEHHMVTALCGHSIGKYEPKLIPVTITQVNKRSVLVTMQPMSHDLP